MKEVKIGIVGLGQMGKKYAQALLSGQVPSAKLSAVCVNGPSKIAQVKTTLGDQIAYFGDFEDFITSSVVDAVIIATPNQTHFAMAQAALLAGKHVLLEKPVSLNLAEGYDLVALATQKGLTFSVMHHLRFNPQIQALKALLDTQTIGQIQRVHWDNLRYYRPQSYYQSLSWTGTWAKDGGGLLLNQAIHELDLLNFLFGQPQALVAHVQFGAYRTVEIDTEATLLLTYPNGSSLTFVTSINEPLGQECLHVVGELGEIIWQGDGQIEVRQLEAGSVKADHPKISKSDQLIIDLADNPWESDLIATIVNFAAHILNHHQPLLAPGLAGVKSLELAKAAWASAYEGKWLTFPLQIAELEDSYKKIKEDYSQ